MSTPDGRADNSDRNAAVKLVEDALKAGRIVQADRDMRVSQLEHAQTMQDIDLVVRDLRAAPPSPAATPATSPPVPAVSTGSQPWPLVTYGPAPHASVDIEAVVGKRGRALGGLVAAMVLVLVVVPIAGAIIAFVNSRDSFPDFDSLGPTDDTTYAPGEAPGKDGINVHTVEGFNELVGALKDTTGETYVVNAVLYPRYAMLRVPTGTNMRYEDFYWDGELTANGTKGTTDDEPLDLALVDPSQMLDLLKTVRSRVDAPTSWYVIVTDHAGQDAQMTAYASNEFGETSYRAEDLAGNVVFDSETPG